MSQAEFEVLVEQYLDRTATVEQVARLRSLLVESPELTRQFKQREKLHRAQLHCLTNYRGKDLNWIYARLINFAQRFNRTASYICLLMVVLVQTRVTLDSDYKGLNLYAINSLTMQDGGDDYDRLVADFSDDMASDDFLMADASFGDGAEDDE